MNKSQNRTLEEHQWTLTEHMNKSQKNRSHEEQSCITITLVQSENARDLQRLLLPSPLLLSLGGRPGGYLRRALVGPPGCGRPPCAAGCQEDAACLVATAAAELSVSGGPVGGRDEVLLTLDECRGHPNLTLLAATNRPYDLDPAVRRSGRLEIEVLLSAPRESERLSILQVHCLGPPPTPPATPSPPPPGRHHPGTPHTPVTEASTASPPHTQLHKTLGFITTRPTPSTPPSGLDHTTRLLERILTEHLLFARAYDALKLKRPRGVLLYGPRGCGKTRLAASLASGRGCTFITATAAHLLSPYVGASEKRIAALFHAARLAQPALVFIDEIDLTKSLEFTQQEVVDLKQQVKHQDQELKCRRNTNETLSEKLEGSETLIKDLEDRCNYQEDYNRRNNLQFLGMVGRQGGDTWEQAAVLVSKLLEEKLQLPDIQLERAHRVGQRLDHRDRPIIARFTRFCDREAVMRNVAKLKGTRIFINEDLCPASHNVRKAQLSPDDGLLLLPWVPVLTRAVT
ncbi:Spermatogenesis-associated protein 5-like protein 1 [Chionoecetes opilio]|uniref:Spermatogenesis-associated protein 5-like protein 1 n=1 Tax=Chionoecetes opilio TaxID=41210 RepID=A0A8J4Y4B7_CHIOP|nr:Spermatogenesis-associated protein 5-like protein 1 [Chionoecetes opilio]